MKYLSPLFGFLLLIQGALAQSRIQRVEPPHWWVGMKSPKLELLVYGTNISGLDPRLDYPGVRLERVIRVPGRNYLFLDLHITPDARAGTLELHFYDDDRLLETLPYELQTRRPPHERSPGFDNADVLYLITPDRFANGDPSNDEVPGMQEKPDRNNKDGRHGGDIAGIRRHLDYIADLGFTAVWLNPVLENDQPRYSYHGYSTTDFYRVDPRFGTNEDYRALADEARRKGIKLIMDMIVNHCGSEHWWMDDPPMPDWINTWPRYTGTNHLKTLVQDPHAAESDRRRFFDGWFVPTMPDLNQRNPHMATYLIQNSIWWTEYLGLGGIRMDTYPYPDPHFMSEWTRRMMEEFPELNIVGEEWHEWPAIVAYWQRGKQNPDGYVSYLPSLMDFPLQAALRRALTHPEGWSSGWRELYDVLALDFLYADPDNLVVFPDNHDMSRIFTQLGEDFDLWKTAMVWTLTTRGIPQLYYGTEILLTNPPEGDHGRIRSDYPGGWPGDTVNAFTGEGLTPRQLEARAFLQKLLKWRRSATAVHRGKLVHFAPENGVYVYFRYDDSQKLMVVLNKNDQPFTLPLDRFRELIGGHTAARDVLQGGEVRLGAGLELAPRQPRILELE